jgi:DNA repair exonuclease SbcCD nuclease subunit
LKIVHIADTHLGFRQLHRVNADGRNVREQDVYDAFERAIDRAVELEPAAVIHAGDLFDSFHPSSAALAVALDGAKRLRDARIPFIVISGNHSAPRFTSAQHVFSVLERFGVEAISGEPRVVRVEALAIHAVPHSSNARLLAQQLAAASPAADADFNVLVAHVGLEGVGHLTGAEAGSVTLSGETLAGAGEFDYIALGHLHKFMPARDNAAYAGSLERLSWADDAPRKGIVEVDLAQDRRGADFAHLHEIAGRPHVPLPDLDAAQIDDLTAALVEEALRHEIADAMVRVTIKNVDTASFAAIDRRAINTALASALHFEIDPQLISSAAGSTAPADLREFLAARTPKGLSVEDFIGRAEGYLAQAEAELAG